MNPSKLKIELAKRGMNNRDLASKTGYSEKQISLIVNGKAPISKSFANQLVFLFPETTLNEWDQENRKCETDDFSFWDKEISLSKILKNSDLQPEEEILLAKSALKIASPSAYVPSVSANIAHFQKENRKNGIDSRSLSAWIDICLFCYGTINKIRSDFHEELFDKYLPLIKGFSSEDPSLTNKYMSMFCQTVGINVIFVPSFPTSFVRGLVTKKDGAYFLFITTRYETNEFLWFTFLHELYHIKNGDLSDNGISLTEADDNASALAKKYFVGTDFEEFKEKNKNNLTENNIQRFSREHGISPGMTITFLWHDKVANYQKFHYLISKADASSKDNIFKECFEKITIGQSEL
jgi:hypothetical protein